MPSFKPPPATVPASASHSRLPQAGAKAAPFVRSMLIAMLVAMILALLPVAAWAGTIEVDGTTCTLPEAVGVANTDTSANGCTLVNSVPDGADTLSLAAGTHSLDGSDALNIAGLTAAPITSTITVVGQGAGATVQRTGSSEYRLFYVNSQSTLTVDNLTIVNFGGTTIQGGAIFNFGGLTMTNSSLVSNTASAGGGLFSFVNPALLLNSTIVSNLATSQGGGGIYNFNSTITIANSSILSNSAPSGGGFYNFSTATNNLTNSTVAYNIATVGGGFHNSSDGINNLTNSFILSNTATNNGGGIYQSDGATTILTNTIVMSNSAPTGGGIDNDGGAITMTGSSLIGNKASVGGALNQDDANAITQIHESCITQNSDTAVRFNNGAEIDVRDNWWGASNGPAGVGPGSGDSVNSDVDFSNFKTSPILGCPFRGGDIGFFRSVTPPGNLLPGQPITYTLTITSNEGRFANASVTVIEALPAAFDPTGVISTGVTITRTGNTFQIGQINPGDVATIQVFGNVRRAIHTDTTLLNTAVLSNVLVGRITTTVSSAVVVPRLNWSSASYTTTEAAGSLEVTITLSPPNPFSPLSVQVVYTDSLESASIAAQLPITVAAGVPAQVVTIPFANDSEIATRTIDLSLQNPLRAALGALRTATIILVEDDEEEEVPLQDIFMPQVSK